MVRGGRREGKVESTVGDCTRRERDNRGNKTESESESERDLLSPERGPDTHDLDVKPAHRWCCCTPFCAAGSPKRVLLSALYCTRETDASVIFVRALGHALRFSRALTRPCVDTCVRAVRLADDVLLAGVRSVTDLMVNPGLINLDFADVQVLYTIHLGTLFCCRVP